MKNEDFYRHNSAYSSFIESQDPSTFAKYAKILAHFCNKDGMILDVGCGTGMALLRVNEIAPQIKIFGIDISIPSIKIASERGIIAKIYDGNTLPFENGYFDVVGSYNVLEHTDDAITFLDEKLRVLKSDGVLILACPNFLSVTNNYHANTSGGLQKLKNLVGLARRLLFPRVSFEKMPTIQRDPIQADDDACNVTNPLDINTWAKKRGLKKLLWSSQSIERTSFIVYLDFGWMRLFLGSCFMVFKKE